MLLVISPAKTLDYKSPLPTRQYSMPDYLTESEELVEQLRLLSPQQISSLMGISDKLGSLNFGRFQDWQCPFTPDNARPAVLAFKGDVYTGLQATEMTEQELAWAQDHLRILSGLYGILRPLDLMQPYRLEMGTKLSNRLGKNLYDFWGEKITKGLNETLESQSQKVLVNLASSEYFKSVVASEINGEIITPVFKDWKNDSYKIISFFAKKARGLMSQYIIKNRLKTADEIKNFDGEGYQYSESMSSAREWVFTRQERA